MRSFIFAIFLLCCTGAKAQVLPPPALYGDGFMPGWMEVDRRGFTMDGERITIKQAKYHALPYRQALRHIRRGRVARTSAFVAAGLGGTFIGLEIGNAIVGEKISGVGIIGGLIFVGGAWGLESISVSQFRKAAVAYNDSASGRTVAFVKFGATDGGMGLNLTF